MKSLNGKIFCVLSLAGICLYGCAAPSKHIYFVGKKIEEKNLIVTESEGEAVIKNENVSEAKRLAIDRALENSLVHYVESFQEIRHIRMFKDIVKIKAKGYVLKYEILKTWVKPKMVKVRIKAWVKPEIEKLVKVIEYDLHIGIFSLPLAVESEDINAFNGFLAGELKKAENHAFTVIPVWESVSPADVSPTFELKELLQNCREQRIDILVLVKIFQFALGPQLVENVRYARIESLSVYWTDTGAIIGSWSRLEKSAKGLDRREAQNKAIEKLSAKCGEIVTKEILNTLGDEIIKVKVEISGDVSFQQFSNLSNYLREICDEQQVSPHLVSDFDSRLIEFDYRGTTFELAEKLQACTEHTVLIESQSLRALKVALK